MRSAHFIHQAGAAEVDVLLRHLYKSCPDAEAQAEEGYICQLKVDWTKYKALLRKIFFRKDPKKVFLFSSFATRWAEPHVDEAVIGDYTVGIVLRGDHVLFTGNGRPVCKLEPGTVFLLNNKRMHGAKPANKADPKPLLFVTADFAAESDRHALSLCAVS